MSILTLPFPAQEHHEMGAKYVVFETPEHPELHFRRGEWEPEDALPKFSDEEMKNGEACILKRRTKGLES